MTLLQFCYITLLTFAPCGGILYRNQETHPLNNERNFQPTL